MAWFCQFLILDRFIHSTYKPQDVSICLKTAQHICRTQICEDSYRYTQYHSFLSNNRKTQFICQTNVQSVSSPGNRDGIPSDPLPAVSACFISNKTDAARLLVNSPGDRMGKVPCRPTRMVVGLNPAVVKFFSAIFLTFFIFDWEKQHQQVTVFMHFWLAFRCFCCLFSVRYRTIE